MAFPSRVVSQVRDVYAVSQDTEAAGQGDWLCYDSELDKGRSIGSSGEKPDWVAKNVTTLCDLELITKQSIINSDETDTVTHTWP